jgi:hypothetical protein
MDALPPTFAVTREALRALCCYVVAPARKARTGRIGLRPYDGAIATPPFDDGTRLVVRGDRFGLEPGTLTAITTLRDAAALVGIDLRADPGVGDDLPPFAPDDVLEIDPAASVALGEWYGFGQRVLDDLREAMPHVDMSEAQLWPEHFDLAVTLDGTADRGAANVGCSPGDAFLDDPYLYVGPHDTTDLADDVWNAPFGAVLGRAELVAERDPAAAGSAFIRRCLDVLSRRGDH